MAKPRKNGRRRDRGKQDPSRSAAGTAVGPAPGPGAIAPYVAPPNAISPLSQAPGTGPAAAAALQVDDKPIVDMAMGLVGYPAVLMAQQLQLFSLLARGPLTGDEVGRGLGLKERPTGVLLSLCTSLGLLRKENDSYALTPMAEMYLLPRSPVSYEWYLDAHVQNDRVYDTFTIARALRSDEIQVRDTDPSWWAQPAKDAGAGAEPGAGGDGGQADMQRKARQFTRFMHSQSMAAALAWPRQVDLSRHRFLVDIGGGSGAHAIGAAMNWPDLCGVVFDAPPVVAEAARYIAERGLGDRVSTCAGDMWNDPLPAGDVHLYSQVVQLFPPEQARALLDKSFAALPSGGRVLIHEMLYDDDKTGPFAVAAYGVVLMLWTRGQMYSGAELAALLRAAGFIDVTVQKTFGYWGIVTGVRP